MTNFRHDAQHSRGLQLASYHVFKDFTPRTTMGEIGGDAPVRVMEGQAISDYRSFVLNPASWPIVAAADITTAPMITGDGTPVTTHTVDATTGVYSMDLGTSATDNHEAVACSHPIFRPGGTRDMGFYARLAISDISTTHTFVGTANMGAISATSSPWAAADDGTVLATIDGIYFLIAAGASQATVTLVSRQDAVTDTETITLDTAIADATVVELAFRVKGDGVILYWARNITGSDAAETGSLAMASPDPSSTDWEPMSWCIAHQNAGAGTDYLRIHDSWCWSNSV
jgi:hypothetical protein